MNEIKKIKHLYWRSGFGMSSSEWSVHQSKSLSETIDRIFEKARLDREKNIDIIDKGKWASYRPSKLNPQEKRNLLAVFREKRVEFSNQWIDRMASATHSAFLEKMCLFWHTHFACELKSEDAFFAQEYLKIIRKHALGNFRDLVTGISRDPAMLNYLNNRQNKKDHPNENYARELLELFTIGIGNYTEKDIKESARAFTGWTHRNGQYYFNAKNHDTGIKVFLGHSGNFDGTDIIDLILRKRETARFICGKIYRFFVNEIENRDHIDQLSNLFYDSGYDIAVLMKKIFTSKWFYAPENIGNKIKSPIELVVGMMKSFPTKFGDKKDLLFLQRALGQQLFKPPNVAGWPGGKHWIDSSTLHLRLNLASWVIQKASFDMGAKELPESTNFSNNQKRFQQAEIDTGPILNTFNKFSKADLTEQLGQYFLQTRIPKFSDSTKASGSKSEFILDIANSFMSLPEYQLC